MKNIILNAVAVTVGVVIGDAIGTVMGKGIVFTKKTITNKLNERKAEA